MHSSYECTVGEEPKILIKRDLVGICTVANNSEQIMLLREEWRTLAES